jgi:phosphate transport system permease protein
MPGIITGLLVAIAISVGETAPLLFTANWSAANPSGALTRRRSAISRTWCSLSPPDQPYQSANDLSYDAALILFVVVLLLAERRTSSADRAASVTSEDQKMSAQGKQPRP